MNLHRSLAPTAVRCRILQVWGWTVPARTQGHAARWCRILQVWGWTVHIQRPGRRDIQVPDPPSVGVDSSYIPDNALRKLVPDPPSVGVDSSDHHEPIPPILVPDPPSVGVDSSHFVQPILQSRCRILQVWGWTVQ